MCPVPVHTGAAESARPGALCDGLTAVVVFFLFLLCVFFHPLSEIPAPVEASQENKAPCGTTLNLSLGGLSRLH